MRKRQAALGVCIFAVAAVGVLLWINRPGGAGPEVDPLEVSQRLHQELASEGTVPITDRGALRAALERIPHGPPLGLPEPDALSPDVAVVTPSPEVHARLLSLIERFFSHLSAADPDTYSSWMRSRGYELSRDPELLEGAGTAWERFTGEAAPPDLDHETLFNRFFPGALTYMDEQMRPVAISLADDTQRVRYLRLGAEAALGPSKATLFIHNWPEAQQWIGYSAKRTVKHWVPPVSLADVVERDGYADCAFVSIGVFGAAGDWIPANIFAYYDSEGEDWHIDQITIRNAPRSLVLSWDY